MPIDYNSYTMPQPMARAIEGEPKATEGELPVELIFGHNGNAFTIVAKPGDVVTVRVSGQKSKESVRQTNDYKLHVKAGGKIHQ